MGCEAVVLERLRLLLPAPTLGAMVAEVVSVVDFDDVYALLHVPLFGSVSVATAGGQTLRPGIDYTVDYLSGAITFNPMPEAPVVNPLPCPPACGDTTPAPGPLCRPPVPLLAVACPTPGRTPLGQVVVNYMYDILPDLAVRALCHLSDDLPRYWCGSVTVCAETGLGDVPCGARKVLRAEALHPCCRRVECSCHCRQEHCRIDVCEGSLRVVPPPCAETTYQVELQLGYGCTCDEEGCSGCLDDCLLDAVANRAAALAYGLPGMAPLLTSKDCTGEKTTLSAAGLAKAALQLYRDAVQARAGLANLGRRGRYRERMGYGRERV
jgi:hypothetical protein